MTAKKNFQILNQLDEQVDNLIATGKWNEAEFRKMFPIALKAAGGDGDCLEFLYMAAKPEWRQRLNAEHSAKKAKREKALA